MDFGPRFWFVINMLQTLKKTIRGLLYYYYTGLCRLWLQCRHNVPRHSCFNRPTPNTGFVISRETLLLPCYDSLSWFRCHDWLTVIRYIRFYIPGYLNGLPSNNGQQWNTWTQNDVIWNKTIISQSLQLNQWTCYTKTSYL